MYSKRRMIILFIILLQFWPVRSTVDLNMVELQYLADHLQIEECRRLVAALHFKSYSKPNALNEAVNKVSEDIPCLRLLLHWNSSKNEGLGETHEMLFHRLQQIGRHDLAEWLGKTVFRQLGTDLKRSLKNPFKEFIAEEFDESVASVTTVPQIDNSAEWLPFDTVCWVIILLMCVVTIVILTYSIFSRCKRIRKSKTRKSRYNYEQMESVIISDPESEETFSFRKNDDLALKLMGA